MKQERFAEEKIVGMWREAEKGEKLIADLCREQGIAEPTFYRLAAGIWYKGAVARAEGDALIAVRTVAFSHQRS